jgi:acetolactate synthase-1/2/3 large subunit
MRHERRKALRESDCAVLAGVPCDFRLDYGKHVKRQATLIAANRSAKEARLNRTPTIAAIGDAALFIEQLSERPGAGRPREAWMSVLRERDQTREAGIDAQARGSAGAPSEHVNPVAFFRALDRAAGDQAAFVADGGDFVATASYILRPRGPLTWLDPGVFGTLGVGAGFAIGAALARPGSEVWLLWGDGASGYGLAEFDTFVRHGIPVIAVVGNDAGWTQIAREQVKMLHDDVGTVLARTAYHEVARAFGAEGIEVKRADQVDEALERARALSAGGRPVLVNVWLDKTDFREGSISM